MSGRDRPGVRRSWKDITAEALSADRRDHGPVCYSDKVTDKQPCGASHTLHHRRPCLWNSISANNYCLQYVMLLLHCITCVIMM